jgi:hypothetical protein
LGPRAVGKVEQNVGQVVKKEATKVVEKKVEQKAAQGSKKEVAERLEQKAAQTTQNVATQSATRGAPPEILEQIAKGKSMQAAVQELNKAGATQAQTVSVLEKVVANAEKKLLKATVQDAPGTIALTGVQFVPGGLTKVIVIAPNGVATFGSAVTNFVKGALEISQFVPN